jgi:hypothetical protein
MTSHWEEFYVMHSTPADFEENKKQINDFCQHISSEQKIVLVTVRELLCNYTVSSHNKSILQ